ncbi:ANTAR domain-containing protein [Cellulomonas terrae]|uniref:Transcriptional regulator n=1 Tax=Cellulomonas terrae TaxID=311234 RepID=A0A511JPU3_9CELL|nr:ANTAR domain-containing protein [Cellulomonas terrae]GEM00042.1 transcriptional regulator [Cellulomonas terrae]
MTARTSAQALADVASALVEDHEITSLLARLVSDCAQLLPADAAAFLVRTADGGFELLSATSHRVDELELYQAQRTTGPCADATRTGGPTSAVGRVRIVDRWPDVGQEIVDAGFGSVHAYPMHWRGHAIGGLNLFAVAEEELSAASGVLAQSFADFATLAIVQPVALADDDLAERVSAALEGRAVVEQAKGVLAFQLGLDMAAAYDELLARSATNGTTLAQVARNVVRAAQAR